MTLCKRAVVLSMYSTAFNILMVIIHLVYFFSFFFSLKLLKKKNVPFLLKTFVLYTGVAFLMYLVMILTKIKILPLTYMFILNYYSTAFHLCFFLYFFKQVLEKNHFKVVATFVCTLALFMTYSISYKEAIKNIMMNAFYSNIALIICSIFYFIELFKSMKLQNLIEEPTFWIVTGVFIGMGTSLPFYAIGGIILRENIYEVKAIITLIGSFAYIAMHLFFIKGFLCSLKMKNSGSLESS